jgi:hypothetical protein
LGNLKLVEKLNEVTTRRHRRSQNKGSNSRELDEDVNSRAGGILEL